MRNAECPTMTRSSTPRRGRVSFGSILLVFAVAVLVLLLVKRVVQQPGSLAETNRLPPLRVAGWLNADEPPTVKNLRGNVVLVDCWATWCLPCLMTLPDLVDLKDRFAGHDLTILGLTPEQGDELESVSDVVTNVPGFDWPVGYGAEPTLELLGATVFPTYFVFDGRGELVWTGHHLTDAEEAVVQALAR